MGHLVLVHCAGASSCPTPSPVGRVQTEPPAVCCTAREGVKGVHQRAWGRGSEVGS